ncbi:MAG: hypothetical protein GY759_09070 [Chloroflexi bacterium]|nr:hypothetical protein [Chloroflexota bacterium]
MLTSREVIEMRDWVHGLVNLIVLNEAGPGEVLAYVEREEEWMQDTLAGMLMMTHRLLSLLKGDGEDDDVRRDLLDAIEAVSDRGDL